MDAADLERFIQAHRKVVAVEVDISLEADLQRWRGYFSRMTYEERVAMTGFLQREVELQPALPVGEGHEGEDADDGEAEPAGGLSANGVAQAD